MPPSYELGAELSIKHIFESHYQLYIDSSFVINLNNINIVNFLNLAKWLENIKNCNSFSIVILNRFYKMNYNNVLELVDKHKTIKEIANNINSNLNTIVIGPSYIFSGVGRLFPFTYANGVLDIVFSFCAPLVNSLVPSDSFNPDIRSSN